MRCNPRSCVRELAVTHPLAVHGSTDERQADAPLPLRKSLRARGLVATLALLAYFIVAGLYVATERARINDTVQGLESQARHEKAVALAEAAIGAALVDVKEASTAERSEPDWPAELRLYMESCATLFAALDEFDPGYARLQRSIARAYDALRAQPVRANWIELREALARAASDLEIRRGSLADQRESLIHTYRRAYDAVTVQTLGLGLIGLVAFGSLAAWFFARLAHDIGRLEAHARGVVRGQRGVALAVHREDELGRLMHAVNRMAVDLDEREQRLALEDRQRSHQDKMLAMSALAAGMAHEVNNPLAVIAGRAQLLRDEAATAPAAELAAHAEQILVQAQRAAQAARQLADVAAPQPADIAWFDLEALVRQVLRWTAYDKRWRGHAFEVVAAAPLPAVRSSADTVQQVLMQFLPTACEAAARTGQTPPRVLVELDAGADATVQVRLRFQAAIDFSQEELQRDLVLARAALAPLGGRLAFGQRESGGAHVTLVLPIDSPAPSPTDRDRPS
jgi:signal transduction histidine kinase